MSDSDVAEVAEEPATERRKGGWPKRIAKWLLGLFAFVLAVLAIGVVVLNSPIGKRFVTEQIGKVAPASGLRFEVGRIEGSLYEKATLHDVSVYDQKGLFLEIPVIELDWRPLSWFRSGLDVRELIIRRGRLMRLPELIPGDPDAPILPDFDIRVDRLIIDDLTVDGDIYGGEDQQLNLFARADIREGRVDLLTNAMVGAEDRALFKLINVPAEGTFDLNLYYNAPADGFFAAMTGMDADIRAIGYGDGTWDAWKGGLYAKRNDEELAAFRLTNSEGRIGLTGRARLASMLDGIPARAVGEVLNFKGLGTLEQSVLSGEFTAISPALRVSGDGGVDLADKVVDALSLSGRLNDPNLFGDSFTLRGTRFDALVNGDFRDLTIEHDVDVAEFVTGDTRIVDLAQRGTATYDGSRWVIPLDARVQRLVTNTDFIDPRLVGGTATGTLVYTGRDLLADDLSVRFPGLAADVALNANLADGIYRIRGPVSADDLAIENLGAMSGNANIDFVFDNAGWRVSGQVDGRMTRIDNATLADQTGGNIRFDGGFALGSAQPIRFNNATFRSAKITANLDGRYQNGNSTIVGRGRHVDYGPFTVQASLDAGGPRADLVFAEPAGGFTDVAVALRPIDDGFGIETSGISPLGDFAGTVNLYSTPGSDTRLVFQEFRVAQTDVAGEIALVEGGAAGDLQLAGGGLDGTIVLAPREGRQGFDVNLVANGFDIASPSRIQIRSGTIDASGLVGGDEPPTVEADIDLTGVRYGGLVINRLRAEADLVDGVGTFEGALAGRRRSRFALQFKGQATSEQVRFVAGGEYAGRDIVMPRYAVLDKDPDGTWTLMPTQLRYAGGSLTVEGGFGGPREPRIDLAVSNMPLSLADVAGADLGLGGTISGRINYAPSADGQPTGEARVKISGLTRSGLVLTSRPIDVNLVANLTPTRLDTRALIKADGGISGRLQGRITGLPGSGGLVDRLYAGDLLAQFRYSGPAEGVWRLAALDAFDITGPLNAAADVTGSLGQPRFRGSVAGDNLRLRSSLSGTDITNMRMRGEFDDARLLLRSFSGTAPNGGTVSGSGYIDLANLGTGRGPDIDLRIAARNAELIEREGLGATVTGPLRIVSNGIGGTIAGRVRLNAANWSLGGPAAAQRLPDIQIREINLPQDRRAAVSVAAPWRFLIDAEAPLGGIDVKGLGLESEWRGNIRLRGTTDEPRIGGQVSVVRGDYTFAGTRFELTKGEISFTEDAPIDPLLDIVAETSVPGLDVTVTIGGSATRTDIDFSSTPPLPREEILARLLFGGSISDLSATDALQLGAAIASLNSSGGGGLDPINRLRTAVGLDRLRIVAADPALDRGTAVALGKNITDQLYVEIITDGQGYSATELEYRVTRWLVLLASVSTIGRESVAAEYRRDY